MKQKSDIKNSASNIIYLTKHKKKDTRTTTSTLAAIIAIKIDHPKGEKPEEFLINQIEKCNNLEILAFEDAMENDNIGLTTIDAQNEALNDA